MSRQQWRKQNNVEMTSHSAEGQRSRLARRRPAEGTKHQDAGRAAKQGLYPSVVPPAPGVTGRLFSPASGSRLCYWLPFPVPCNGINLATPAHTTHRTHAHTHAVDTCTHVRAIGAHIIQLHMRSFLRCARRWIYVDTFPDVTGNTPPSLARGRACIFTAVLANSPAEEYVVRVDLDKR